MKIYSRLFIALALVFSSAFAHSKVFDYFAAAQHSYADEGSAKSGLLAAHAQDYASSHFFGPTVIATHDYGQSVGLEIYYYCTFSSSNPSYCSGGSGWVSDTLQFLKTEFSYYRLQLTCVDDNADIDLTTYPASCKIPESQLDDCQKRMQSGLQVIKSFQCGVYSGVSNCVKNGNTWVCQGYNPSFIDPPASLSDGTCELIFKQKLSQNNYVPSNVPLTSPPPSNGTIDCDYIYVYSGAKKSAEISCNINTGAGCSPASTPSAPSDSNSQQISSPDSGNNSGSGGNNNSGSGGTNCVSNPLSCTNGGGGGNNNSNGGTGTCDPTKQTCGTCDPTKQTCGNGSAETTDCTQPPKCTGDSLQCGFITQQWKSTCDVHKVLTDIDKDQKSSYESALDSDNSSQLNGPANQVSNSLTDMTSRLSNLSGTSSCPADYPLQFKGKTFYFPLSKLCYLLNILKVIIHLTCYFFTFRMILWAIDVFKVQV